LNFYNGPNKIDQLSRKLREEMLGIDGATIIDKEGHVLVVGAIVKVDGGSESGGRRAAAKALSQLGFSVKISADGKMEGFMQGKNDEIFSLG